MAIRKKVDRTEEFEKAFAEQVELWKKDNDRFDRGELDDSVAVVREFPESTVVVINYTEVKRKLFKKEEFSRTATFVKLDKKYWKREMVDSKSKEPKTVEDKCDTKTAIKTMRELLREHEGATYTLTVGKQ